jgi:hypothetical protein
MSAFDVVLKTYQVVVLGKGAKQEHVTVRIGPEARFDQSVAISVAPQSKAACSAVSKKVSLGHHLSGVENLHSVRSIGRWGITVKPRMIPMPHETADTGRVNLTHSWPVPEEVHCPINLHLYS